MLIRNINIYQKHGKTINNIYIANGKLEILDNNTEPTGLIRETIHANKNDTLMPGLLDAHVHGQGGPDFADVGKEPDHLHIIAKKLGETGLSYAMATLISLDIATLTQSLKAINDFVVQQKQNPTPGYTRFVGIHLEGPFIAKHCKGAHAESALQDTINLELFKKIISAAPDIKEWKITLAPDLPGAQSFIKDVKQLENEGIFVKVFIGHANPEDKDTIDKAVQSGIAGFTHLGNACQETCCREERALYKHDAKSHVVQWVLDHPDQCPSGVELIVDGMHLSQSFVSLVKKTLGNKVVLVTDALGPTGLLDGLYSLGTLTIRKEGHTFYSADDNGDFILKEGVLLNGETGKVKSLCGSGVALPDCIKRFCDWTKEKECDVETIMDTIYYACIENPRVSSLSQHAIKALPDDENFTIFDEQGRLVMSLCNGKINRHQVMDADLCQGLHTMFNRRL